MEGKIRRSLREPVQAFPGDLAEKAGTRTKNRNEAGGGGGGGGGGGNIRELTANVIFKLRVSQNIK